MDELLPLKIIYEPGFVTDGDYLFQRLLSDVKWDERLRSRGTASFGRPYNYSGMMYAAAPMHELLIPIVDRLESLVGLSANNCLANYYPTGESTMGFHSDANADLALGSGVAIVSLGSARTIVFRAKRTKTEERRFDLENGSLLFMAPEVQDNWKHAIPATVSAGPRISLTFRRLRNG
jgi:alkylated DNA repair dioxygenase AlkB